MPLAQARLGLGVLGLCSPEFKVIEGNGISLFAECCIVAISTANDGLGRGTGTCTQGRGSAVNAGQGGHYIVQIGPHAVYGKLILCFVVGFSVIFFSFAQSNKMLLLRCDTG